jgi:hypothetical protein
MLYSWIRGGLADNKGQDPSQYETLQNYLLEIAEDNGYNNLTEYFHGHLLPNDELCKLEEEIMAEYDDDAFWHELITLLGQRDFWRTVTPAEEKEIKKQNCLPERVQDFYDKYEKEFEEHGIEKLEIKNN